MGVKAKSLKVLVCSGNLGNAQPDSESMAAWLPADGAIEGIIENTPYPLVNGISKTWKGVTFIAPEGQNVKKDNISADIIAIGMQEATFEGKRAASADSQINSPGQKVKSAGIAITSKVTGIAQKGFGTVQTVAGSKDHTKRQSLLYGREWSGGTSVLHKLVQERLPSYEIVVGFQRGEMRLIIMVKKELVGNGFIKVLSVKAENTGIASVAANKGGIVAHLLANDGTELSFCTAHLAAHEGVSHYKARCSNLNEIMRGTSKGAYDFSITSHYSFVFGDLNFRSVIPNVKSEDQAEKVRKMVAHKNWNSLYKADELQSALDRKDCLAGFKTLPCDFPPTFKVERKAGFVYKENRTPSYTDRVLWKCADKLECGITPLLYEPIADFTTSDHKPIRSAFNIKLNECINPVSELDSRKSWSNRLMRKDKNLHIFFTDLKCENLSSGTSGHNPSPYISFASRPKELVRNHRSRWEKIMDKIRISGQTKRGKKKDGVLVRTSRGWTRTSRKRDTKNTDWKEEEVHLVLKTKEKDGIKPSITGAMLFITVHDASSVVEGQVIGTFALNLAQLYKSSRMCCSHHGGWNVKSLRHMHKVRRLSNHSLNSQSDEYGLKTFPIVNQPLLKNGEEHGHISGLLETWWYEEVDESEKTNSISTGRKDKQTRRRAEIFTRPPITFE